MLKTTSSSITDIPRNVEHGEKDTFGIEPFENGLTRFIEHTSTPITIALQGEWGSGKTSLMNSLKKNLSTGDSAGYYSVWLNTWEYALMKNAASTLIDIITGLIQEVSAIANVDENQTRKIINKLWGVGKTAMKFAAKTAADKVVDGSSEIVEGIFAESGKSSIGEIRTELEGVISDCIKKDNKQGFIFFIDDLDRIDPPVAVQLLELLKNIFTLKNCVFVLAIDYDVVIKGLEPKFGKLSDQNEREFRSFFDKIIQVPFSMPVTSYEINGFLRDSLLAINYINETQSKDNELIAKFSELSNLSVGTNPRALKRLINSLSLINCINATKGHSEEDNQLNDDLELLVNFTLVSIQIAYPPVYGLLSRHSAFDKWNENIALQMNLKTLDQQSIDKLTHSEEFDEEWEQVLFRLCENDHYLKKRALNISRLLNSLKLSINEKGEEVEDIVGAVISLSSVTNLEAFDKPVVDYHRGNFLKHLRKLLIPELKKRLPEIAKKINTQGKRVQSNAFIKFSEKDWQKWIRLSSNPIDGQIRLMVTSGKRMCSDKYSSIQDAAIKLGYESELKSIEEVYNNFSTGIDGVKQKNLFDNITKTSNEYAIEIIFTFTLSRVEEFYEKENVEHIGVAIAKFYTTINSLYELSTKMRS